MTIIDPRPARRSSSAPPAAPWAWSASWPSARLPRGGHRRRAGQVQATVVDELGFDACIDYKQHRDLKPLSAALKDAAAPQRASTATSRTSAASMDARLHERVRPRRHVRHDRRLQRRADPPLAPQLILVNRMRCRASSSASTWRSTGRALKELGTAVATGKLKYRETWRRARGRARAFIGLLKGATSASSWSAGLSWATRHGFGSSRQALACACGTGSVHVVGTVNRRVPDAVAGDAFARGARSAAWSAAWQLTCIGAGSASTTWRARAVRHPGAALPRLHPGAGPISTPMGATCRPGIRQGRDAAGCCRPTCAASIRASNTASRRSAASSPRPSCAPQRARPRADARGFGALRTAVAGQAVRISAQAQLNDFYAGFGFGRHPGRGLSGRRHSPTGRCFWRPTERVDPAPTTPVRPFSEKVRLVLGLKGLAWRSVDGCR